MTYQTLKFPLMHTKFYNNDDKPSCTITIADPGVTRSPQYHPNWIPMFLNKMLKLGQDKTE